MCMGMQRPHGVRQTRKTGGGGKGCQNITAIYIYKKKGVACPFKNA